MFTKTDYDTGTAAALRLIRHEVADVLMPKVPFMFRGMIPVDKEPAAAAAITKCVLDAVAGAHKEADKTAATAALDAPIVHAAEVNPDKDTHNKAMTGDTK